MDFSPRPEHLEVMAVARRIADELAPGYVERERAGTYPWKPLAVLGDVGLLGLNVAEDAGGQGAGELLTGFVCEILGRADYALPLMLMEAGSVAKLLHLHGSPAAQERWLPELIAGRASAGLAFTESGAGSDLKAANRATRASQDGDTWVVQGEKCSMSYVDSQLAIVLAGTPDGPALLCVPTDEAGVTVAPFEDMGASQLGRAVVSFDGVRVPGDALLGTVGKGLNAALSALTSSKIHVAAATLGVAAASLDEALEWAKQRETFGAALATRQGVMFPLVDMYTQLEAARLLVHKALWLVDNDRPFVQEAAMVKAWVPALAARICHESLLVLGNVGYSREHPAQARLRDVIGAELGEGTANIQRLIAARCLTGQSAT